MTPEYLSSVCLGLFHVGGLILCGMSHGCPFKFESEAVKAVLGR